MVVPGPSPTRSRCLPTAGASRRLPTWVVGKVLRLASFPLPVDDVEVHLHRRADVLVPVLGDLHEKHVLEGRGCH